MEPRRGMEPRRLGDTTSWTCSWPVSVRSRTAPAVLGRSLISGDEWKAKVVFKPNSTFVMEITDEILPETEWPGRAVIVLEVSLETSDTGLGMYSRVSEKPTLVRTAGLGGSCTSVVATGSSAGDVDTSGSSARGSGTSETAIAVVVVSGCDFSSLTSGSS